MTHLLYGAYGYTGELIAREAVDRELDPVVAGRNGTKTRGVGIQLGTDSRVFDVEDAAEIAEEHNFTEQARGEIVDGRETVTYELEA